MVFFGTVIPTGSVEGCAVLPAGFNVGFQLLMHGKTYYSLIVTIDNC